MTASKLIDTHIRLFPKSTQLLLKKLRSVIKEVAPKAEEAISYGIPTFVLNGNLVHFSGYKTHIGFYPGASPLVVFKQDLAPYKVSKGTMRFPLDRALPIGLIKKIVRYRIQENALKDKKRR